MNLRTLFSLGALVSCLAIPGIASAHDMGHAMGHGRFDTVAMHRGDERFGRRDVGRERGFERGRGEVVRAHDVGRGRW
jgi:hypothetical protein